MTAGKRRPRGAVRIVQPHHFAGDGQPDHRGRERCRHCQLGEQHPVHPDELPEPDPGAAEISRRITGERE
jgi:hypothetical protein